MPGHQQQEAEDGVRYLDAIGKIVDDKCWILSRRISIDDCHTERNDQERQVAHLQEKIRDGSMTDCHWCYLAGNIGSAARRRFLYPRGRADEPTWKTSRQSGAEMRLPPHHVTTACGSGRSSYPKATPVKISAP